MQKRHKNLFLVKLKCYCNDKLRNEIQINVSINTIGIGEYIFNFNVSSKFSYFYSKIYYLTIGT